MKPIRVLWISFHRTARYEEVSALLRCGFEVVPTTGESDEFPNAVEHPEERDPLYPPWRRGCTVPEEVLRRVRDRKAYADPDAVPQDVVRALDEWFDVVWVGSYSRLAHSLLERYRGAVVLRAYGGFPYTGSLGTGRERERALDLLGASERYLFCPALPYQSFIEDPRLSRRMTFWPACVTAERLPARWAGADSDPFACEVIGLIDRYRAGEYARFVATYGDLPLRIFGQNPPGGAGGSDARIVGTLPDDAFFAGIAACRVLVYEGLGSRYHLHYHPLEALMMGVPVIFSSASAIARTALWMGIPPGDLAAAGMSASPAEAHALAARLLRDPAEALALSARQERLREIYRPAPWDGVAKDMITAVARSAAYERDFRDPVLDRPAPASALEGLRHRLGLALQALLRRGA